MLVIITGCDGSREASREFGPPSASAATQPHTTDDQVETPLPTPASASQVAQAAGQDFVQQGDWFEDVSASSGLTTSYHTGRSANNYYILETLGGGVACLDFDLDSHIDAAFASGGSITSAPSGVQIAGLPISLFRSEIFSFQRQVAVQFRDVTSPAGLNTPLDYSHGLFVADYDCDGLPDLLVTCYGACRLFGNCGDGTFQEKSSHTLTSERRWWTGAAWGDVDHDGFPDLFLTGYLDWSPDSDQPCFNADGQRDVCGPRSFAPANDRLLRNCGDGGFEDITGTAGLRHGGNGLAVLSADVNGDSLTDFYIANDETDNFLYLGRPDGTLQEVAHAAGVAVNQYGMHDGSMGLDVGDYDRDGREDLWVTNFELEDNCLYRNLGEQLFQQTTNTAGLAGRSRLHVGFGTAMEDFDSDGWLDLFVTNGHVFYNGGQLPWRQHPQLFQNTGNGRFRDVSGNGGSYFRSTHAGRGASVADVNNDGAQDILVTHLDGPPSLLLNRCAVSAFLTLKLIGTGVTRDALGAGVSVKTPTGVITRPVRSGAGYLSSFDSRIIVPLPVAEIPDPPRFNHVTPKSNTSPGPTGTSTETGKSETIAQPSATDPGHHSVLRELVVVVRWPGGDEETFAVDRTGLIGRTDYLIQGRGTPYVVP